ncbi:hypothetical protein AWN90_10750 [Nocardia terpenica]|uniref:Uncharacterized protein n=1 Tax=Nocardia terpenica TaxID=455432 RepID=A0A164HB25_9NOCA|nr:hypothetical protein AWN90_10750 [Nocardia terpenica]
MCYPDYDYNVVNVQFIGVSTLQGEAPVVSCTTTAHGTCHLQYSHSVSVTNTLTQSSELSTDTGLDVGDVNAKIGSKLTTTEQTAIQNLNSFTATADLPGDDLAPTYSADGYLEYNTYKYTLQKYDTQAKKVVSSQDFYYYVPVGLKGVPRK